MKKYFENLAKALLGMKFQELEESQQHVIESIANKTPVASDVNEAYEEQLTFGQKVADKVAEFGGSWPFIIIFMSIMVVWVLLNSLWFVQEEAFDPFPFILLNLVLSTLAAIQAPIIMMSQNRQSTKDRLATTQNYEVSLKTDLEIMRLHEKLDKIQAHLDKGSNKESNE